METFDDQLRREAVARLKRRRTFWIMLMTYLIMNAFFVVVWALTGAGYFWPGWVMLGWGIGIAFGAVRAFVPGAAPGAPSEQQITDEVRKLRDRDAA
jgi:hypothetical protein